MSLRNPRLACGAALVALACGGCVYTPPPTPILAPASAQSETQQQNCREFQKTVTIGGKPQQAYGTMCQQPDGSWKTVSPEAANPPPASANTTYYYAPYYYPPYPYPYYYPGYW